MVELTKHCGWWWPFEGAVILTERPSLLKRDGEHRLHNETGPAIEYPDGWGFHAWHGIHVPSHWIEGRENLDPIEVLKSENVEQRAAGCAIIGWEKMLDHLPHKIIDSDPDPEHGELVEVSIPDLPEPGRFLKAKCPRNGWIFEGVPTYIDKSGDPSEFGDEIDTVIKAQAWRLNIPVDQFEYPSIRT